LITDSPITDYLALRWQREPALYLDFNTASAD
jgi:hypothetical protein